VYFCLFRRVRQCHSFLVYSLFSVSQFWKSVERREERGEGVEKV